MTTPEQPNAGQPQTVEDREAERAKFYGTYVATQAIYIDGVRAFNVGDPVGVDHVANNVVPSDAVAKTSTKAGKAAAGD